MKYIKTFEQYAVVAGPDVNEGFMDAIKAGKDALAKGINKLGSSNLDLNMDDAKVAEKAKKQNITYVNGKITLVPTGRGKLLTSYRESLKKGGIPDQSIDKTIVLFVANNGWGNLTTDENYEGTGSILTFNKEENTVNMKSANVSAGKKEV
jgi:hypothetical protein